MVYMCFLLEMNMFAIVNECVCSGRQHACLQQRTHLPMVMNAFVSGNNRICLLWQMCCIILVSDWYSNFTCNSMNRQHLIKCVSSVIPSAEVRYVWCIFAFLGHMTILRDISQGYNMLACMCSTQLQARSRKSVYITVTYTLHYYTHVASRLNATFVRQQYFLLPIIKPNHSLRIIYLLEVGYEWCTHYV